MTIQCPEHRSYKAVRRPRGRCLSCWTKWIRASDNLTEATGRMADAVTVNAINFHQFMVNTDRLIAALKGDK